MNFISDLIVLGQAQGAQGGASGGIGQMLIMIVPLFVIMYFLMIRPQQQKQKAQAEMLKRLKAGDRVRTVGGILGTIKVVTEQTVKLEVAPNTVIEFLRGAVDKVMDAPDPDAAKKEDKKEGGEEKK